MLLVSPFGVLGLLIFWFIIWELVGVHIWDEPTSWLVELVLEYGCGDGPLCYYCGLLCSYCGLLSYYWLWTMVLLLCSYCGLLGYYWLCYYCVTIGFATPVIGLITPVVTIGYYWTSVPVSGTHHPVWLVTIDFWLVVWLGWWLARFGWEVVVGMSFFVGSYEFFGLFGWYHVILFELGCSLLDYLWFVMHYAFVISYWL